MSHRITRTLGEKLASLAPFGIGHVKPKHFRDMFQILWRNRDNLPYAWKVLTRGVCDGCALGVAGLHDWTISGVHLCMTRLNLLRLNTMPALDIRLLQDVDSLRDKTNAELRELGRIPYPMIRRKGDKGFKRISWFEATTRIADKIRETDPKRFAMFVTSRGVTNEIYYMAQKAMRYMGSNHVDNAARLCHAPSSVAMKRTLGVAATTCSYKDWYGTDLIIFFGANPANDQPVTTKYLHEAKQHGSKVILVNPYLEPGMKKYWVPSTASSALFGTNIADYWFPVSQGGDIAFIYGVLKHMFENGWEDNDFILKHTSGFPELRKQAEKLDWETIEQQSGLTRSSMLEFAQLLHNARTAVLVWSMGITQHAYGVDAVQMVLNLGLTKGFVGRDKCGLMPIRGHSSVQGGAEMGAYATAFPGGKPVNGVNARALSKEYGFRVPAWKGMDTTQMVHACGTGELDVFYSLGGNFLRTLPDPKHVARSLAKVPLRIHQDIILTDQMLIDPNEEVLLLPAKTRYEQDDGGTETITERRIAFSPEIPRQVGEARAEWKILREIALAVRPDKKGVFGCETGQEMRDEIARVVPFYDGFQHLSKTGDAYQYGGPHLCADWNFDTEDHKAHIFTARLPDLSRGEGMFEVSSRRGKQFNTLIYDETDPLNGAPRDAILMAASDAASLNLHHNDRIRIKNRYGSMEGTVFLAPMAPGNLQVHWPEGNVIVRKDLNDKQCGVPDYNAQVTVEKLHAA